MSSISKLEYVQIMATLHAYDNKRFDCNHCLKLYSNRTDRDEMIKREREAKNCQKVGSFPIHRIGEKLQFSTCIGNFYSDTVGYLIGAFSKFELGVMPYSGSYLDQPGKIIEAFEVIASWKADKIKAQEMLQKSRTQGRLTSGRRR